MAMPWQLARSDRRRKSEPRAIVELTPHIDIHELRHIIPRDFSTYLYANSFKYPFAQKLILSRINIEVFLHLGYTQTVALHWVRTGFGRPRPMFVCSQCHCGARRLFFKCGQLACKDCHRAQYLSQKQNTVTRKRLAACKLRIELGGLPDIREPLPARAKWKHKKRYQRLRNQAQALETQANRHVFRKQIALRTFPYHIA
jgi:hypothetical protein